MFKSLWLKFFVLLIAVVAVGLSATFFLRNLMLRDFSNYLEGEMQDRVYWVTAALESAYEDQLEWARADIVESVIWGLMLGIEVRLFDADGKMLMDAEQALDSVSPLVEKRVVALSQLRAGREGATFVPYVLFYGGQEIGRIETRLLFPKKEALFISRTNQFMLYSILALGGVAVVLSVFFSRKLTGPIHELTEAALKISEGDLKGRVSIKRSDEIGTLSATFNAMADTLVLQESLRRKLTSNVAHELRTPLGAVRGELEGMMDGLIPISKENLQSLYDEIGRLSFILDSLGELSQAEASALSLNRRKIDFLPFARNITGRFQQVFDEKGVALALDAPEGLWLDADPDRLSQVLINLISNALRATPPGGEVRVCAAKAPAGAGAPGGVDITVGDTGPGIGTEDLPFIFERFYRGPEGGLGIGLTIVKELVEAHGGTITAESPPGGGASFKISLSG